MVGPANSGLTEFIFMATQVPQHRASRPTEIPDKLYFRIGEVAKLCGVPAYVLRFWESEFSQLRPNKSGTGQRLYRKRDVEMALRIRQLVHDEGYTLAGARQVLQENSRKKPAALDLPLTKTPTERPEKQLEQVAAVITKIRKDLHELLGMLSGPEPAQQSPSRPRPKADRKEKNDPGLFDS
jgi:DNA-binding transcriptional MerR regulator